MYGEDTCQISESAQKTSTGLVIWELFNEIKYVFISLVSTVVFVGIYLSSKRGIYNISIYSKHVSKVPDIWVFKPSGKVSQGVNEKR